MTEKEAERRRQANEREIGILRIKLLLEDDEAKRSKLHKQIVDHLEKRIKLMNAEYLIRAGHPEMIESDIETR